MKKYTYTQQVEAIKWTGDNKMEIQEALGYRFDINKTFESDEKGYSLKLHPRGKKEYERVYKDEWIVLDKYALILSKVDVVCNSDFEKEFVISKEKSEGTE